ncbi:MAG: TatD family hydrolase, partial [Ilumatobacteraceae bacterium]|nr:TatD family hydrolase [Ilumatobacteraceae bacterium]
MKWTDTHCHILDDKMSVSADDTLIAARLADVNRFIVIGTDEQTSSAAIEL